jgi:glycosyltransferase involved in cell wall biosynthesis
MSAVPEHPAGAGRYIVELARALSRRDDLSLSLVTKAADGDRLSRLAPTARVLPLVPSGRPVRLLYEQLLLGRRVNALGRPAIDAYHGPHYTVPAGLRTARVATVHDLTFLDHPEWHERSKALFFRAAIRRAARICDVLVCVSRTTAERLGELMQPSAELIVAEHGVDRERFSPGPVAEEALPAGIDLSSAIVYVGTIEPRKGVSDLVRAFDRLAAGRPTLSLVLAGRPGWRVGEVEAALSGASHSERVHRLGFVPDVSVVALLRAARVVCYPSHEEGFGLPALEALATGAPLVTIEGTAMAELAGPAAWLAPPGDPGALAARLAAALDSPPEERSKRREEGMARASRYSWERTAGLHVEAYVKAIDRAAKRSKPPRRGRPPA